MDHADISNTVRFSTSMKVTVPKVRISNNSNKHKLPGNIDKSFCGFTRISQAGFVDVFDARLDDVKDLVDCESKCLAWNKGFCRSYTYDKSSKLCYISHANQKALGRSVLESLGENLSSGEVDDCLKCRALTFHFSTCKNICSQTRMPREVA